ncbi:MAG: sulfocyanin-like copper-binding protein [Gemmatimonadota bacterium]
MALFGVAPLAAQDGDGADWIQVDTSAREVKLDIVAGLTSENFSWNFNGYFGGGATLTVPVGYRVVIDFRNDDKAVPHSIGVSEIQTPFPPLLTDLTPVFTGAISEDPTSMTDSTMPGESETVIFTADKAGTYALLCYIPAHAATGMWITLEVSTGDAVSFDPGD